MFTATSRHLESYIYSPNPGPLLLRLSIEAMPHSVSLEPSPTASESQEEDSTFPDAPGNNLDEQEIPLGENGPEGSAARSLNEEVKLEDLFNDDDEDEEFPSSSPSGAMVESSPPAAPL